ncbi:hypothetical protein K2173_017835 [Erythroxylum novogranatense]|uniref:RNA helicase n=1 Tax=Erythroxylum novogranatense TaxID=1862640 RepID=A0AAV8SMJ3_9ROSI|nr:hypothetical protein K2173_017835 [Erythroxylum novogranatense]
MSWSESTRRPTRPTRPTYLPPYLRRSHSQSQSYTNAYAPPFTCTTYRHHFDNSQSSPDNTTISHFERRPRPRGGRRGRGRYGSSDRGDLSQRWSSPGGKHHENLNLCDITEKLDELEFTDDNDGDDTVDNTNGINFDAYDDIPVETTGSNVPAPVTNFAEIDLEEGLSENLKRCKYLKPTPIQKHAIPIAVAGRDLMACAQTGSGKTAAFCFPIINGILRNRSKLIGYGCATGAIACPSALILSPTRELSCQIQEEAKKFAYRTGLKIVVAYGGTPITHQFRNLEKGVDILVATPGRLVDMIERARVSLVKIKYLALDEADRMLDMGFEPQIRRIVQQMGMPAPGKRQTLLFSATFPHEIQRLASDFLSDYIFLTVGRVGSSTDLIVQRVELVQEMNKRSHLMDLIRSQNANGTNGKHALTLVFVETKRGADALEQWLNMHGCRATAIHGDKVQMERERALKAFKSGSTPILVATDVASRGLDVPHVSHVINFDLPRDIDDYVHRIGRTGRAGKSGLATAFFSEKNVPLAKALAELMEEANQDVPSWLTQYAYSPFSGAGSGRMRRYSGSKFGGFDYRNEDNYCHLSAHGGDFNASSNAPGFPVSPSNIPNSNDYHAASASDSFPVVSHENEFGLGSVIATGWD